ncbi:hypothetical protein D0815_08745 [Vibrio parahaemolyticus]|nr:hypothetical protein [Vibrio parahaemolyticus]EGQ8705650.1 hypothetical protein [Vibrio parahaemolyticus]EGQ9166519.1 hypothetical protein [Vibrio parahaemolyticus]EGR2285602.1 hypothetical protein [Vibrio parahaemolyticus]EGR3458192.1 hypothetical protein [Vibrio parahaemolyticus]
MASVDNAIAPITLIGVVMISPYQSDILSLNA